MSENKKFFIIEKKTYSSLGTRYSIVKDKQFDLTEATRNLLALDQLNDDKKNVSYFLEPVSGEPLVLDDLVKENGKTEEMLF